MIRSVTYQASKNFRSNLYALEVKSRFADQTKANGFYKGYGYELNAEITSENTITIKEGAFVVQARMNEVVGSEVVKVLNLTEGYKGYIVARCETYHIDDTENCTFKAYVGPTWDSIDLEQDDIYSRRAENENMVYEYPLYSFEIIDGQVASLIKLIQPIDDYEDISKMVKSAESLAADANGRSQNAEAVASDAQSKTAQAQQSAATAEAKVSIAQSAATESGIQASAAAKSAAEAAEAAKEVAEHGGTQIFEDGKLLGNWNATEKLKPKLQAVELTRAQYDALGSKDPYVVYIIIDEDPYLKHAYLTRSAYDSIPVKDDNTLYIVTDENYYLKFAYLTKAMYDLIPVKESDTMYIITDEEIFAKSSDLDALEKKVNGTIGQLDFTPYITGVEETFGQVKLKNKNGEEKANINLIGTNIKRSSSNSASVDASLTAIETRLDKMGFRQGTGACNVSSVTCSLKRMGKYVIAEIGCSKACIVEADPKSTHFIEIRIPVGFKPKDGNMGNIYLACTHISSAGLSLNDYMTLTWQPSYYNGAFLWQFNNTTSYTQSFFLAQSPQYFGWETADE